MVAVAVLAGIGIRRRRHRSRPAGTTRPDPTAPDGGSTADRQPDVVGA